LSRLDSTTRSHILNVVERFLASNESSELRIADVAKSADVGVPTVYYYFTSRLQLVAEAQALAYGRIVEPLHQFLDAAEKALDMEDMTSFLEAVGDNVESAWNHSHGEDGWKIMRLLMDIWADSETRRGFCNRLDTQLTRWASAIDNAKALGWIDGNIDTTSLVAACWAGSLGQVIFSESAVLTFDSVTMREFFLEVVAGPTHSQRPPA
jgi:AcrR family transcriptional regulator